MGEKSSCYVFPYSKNGNLGEQDLNTMTKCSKERLRRKVRVVPVHQRVTDLYFKWCYYDASYVNIGAYVDAVQWLTLGQQ
jgi:hypothetical protein